MDIGKSKDNNNYNNNYNGSYNDSYNDKQRDIKKEILIVVDELSFRGSNEEEERIGVIGIINNEKKNNGLNVTSKHQQLTFGIIKALLNIKVSNI